MLAVLVDKFMAINDILESLYRFWPESSLFGHISLFPLSFRLLENNQVNILGVKLYRMYLDSPYCCSTPSLLQIASVNSTMHTIPVHLIYLIDIS